MLGPKALPTGIVERLSSVANAVLAEGDIIARLRAAMFR
jgi:hypothetical protein